MPNSTWLTNLVSFLSGMLGIVVVNLAGIRSTLILYGVTNTLYASSFIVAYKYHHYHYYLAMAVLNGIGYGVTIVGGYMLAVSYPSERWKARTLAIFLLLSNISITMGDVVAMYVARSDEVYYHTAVVFLCITSLTPFVACTLAPSSTVVRDNGVYLIARKTTLRVELRETARIFTNRYMLLLLPYMFSYTFLVASVNPAFPNVLTIVLYDVGRLSIIIMGTFLDLGNAERRKRGLIGFFFLALFVVLSAVLIIVMRTRPVDWSKLDQMKLHQTAKLSILEHFLDSHGDLVYTVYFFSGLSSMFVQVFGFWLMGTLTNDTRATARFVGSFISFMALGSMVGIELTLLENTSRLTMNVPVYIAVCMALASLVCVFFVVRRITDTNDWSLGRIRYNVGTRKTPPVSMFTQRDAGITEIARVKYAH
ncbi:hypothetical protein GQ54DRAFT_258246 [Martensiomyces pterosporus]|nr:hypothetical protein GQ54DRAFT_258246 [Martensiomyces pterosporus]